MKKRSLFLSGLFAISLLVGGVLVGCNQANDNNDITDNADTTDTTDNTDNTDSTDSIDNIDNTDSTDSTDTPDTTTATTYNIAFSETNEVVATLSETEATAGTKIDITIVSVPDGYNITSITSDVSGLEIQAESETLYTFTMPKSDVNLTINIETSISVPEYGGNVYIINTGDVPSNLQASSFYVEIDGSSCLVERINFSIYYIDRDTFENCLFGISDANIDIDDYDFTLSGYYYGQNSEQKITISFDRLGTYWYFYNSEYIVGGIFGVRITIDWDYKGA